MFIFPDVVLPAILVGTWNGRISEKIPASVALGTACLLGMGIVLLLFSYPIVMPYGSAWWRDPNGVISAMTLALNGLWSSLVTVGITTAYLRKRHATNENN